MALHPDFPKSPHAILDPSVRWFPADEALREKFAGKLIPPLVEQLRLKVKEFRDGGYAGASETSKSLLNWWFKEPHLVQGETFQYFFAQREALETIVYLYDVADAKTPYDLMRFDGSRGVSKKMFDENWRRWVIKMATGSGKTKVMSLALAWSFFHKLYEEHSELSRNFLVIAPNIIVLDRIYRDFADLRIFSEDPVLPINGYCGRNWKDDFQLTLHRQDDVRVMCSTGNIFLTNIHRVYDGGEEMTLSAEDENTMDYFLGKKPVGKTNDSRIDLGMIVRDIDELMVINDEAHHIRDKKVWFESIKDIHHHLLQKNVALSLQIDVTATPRHDNGAIFVQTVSDYPLVEAISQNVVKHPILPDKASRTKLSEKPSSKYAEKYANYLDLGVIEWRKVYAEHQKAGKKAILFVMTDDTKNCDDVAEYLEDRHADLKDAVLVIHTKKNGEISEGSKSKKDGELEELRKQANSIDSNDSPYKVIVSVLMLKEGWDVKNVTTIVGLRAYSSKSNILPEQTLGRGLRRMYPGDSEEYVSVVGTDAFMEFVESIEQEGVSLERKAMGLGTKPIAPLIIEVDHENAKKDIDVLDIEIPKLTFRIYREYKNLNDLDIKPIDFHPVDYRQFSEKEQCEIVFRDITTGEVDHITQLDGSRVGDVGSVVGYFSRKIMQKMRLVGSYDVLYGKVKIFIRDSLFGQPVELESANTLRNLSETEATKTLVGFFEKSINALTVRDRGHTEIQDTIKLRQVRPFTMKNQECLVPEKSVFNLIVGDSHLELQFSTLR